MPSQRVSQESAASSPLPNTGTAPASHPIVFSTPRAQEAPSGCSLSKASKFSCPGTKPSCTPPQPSLCGVSAFSLSPVPRPRRQSLSLLTLPGTYKMPEIRKGKSFSVSKRGIENCKVGSNRCLIKGLGHVTLCRQFSCTCAQSCTCPCI